MTERIFHSILLAAAVAMIAGIAVITVVLNGYLDRMRINELTAELDLAARGVERMGLAYFDQLTDTDDMRFTVVAENGVVLYDSAVDTALLENHAGREEIRMAMETGWGESRRYSATLTEETIYRAKRLSDGTVLRLAVQSVTLFTLLMSTLQPISIVVLAILALSAFLAHRMARRIIGPLNAIDLDAPLEHPPYEELAPMLDRIHAQHKQINKQMTELRQKTDEFDALVANMSESLLLLNARGRIISINPAAKEFLHIKKENCIGFYFNDLHADREEAERLQDAFCKAMQNGRCEYKTEHAGRVLHISVSRIHTVSQTDSTETGGVVVLGYDITEAEYAERNRREFTANVSHELKTPLQSIIGSAELVEQGMVRTEDMPRFIGRIRSEAQRLVNLIGDIICLSELDEQTIDSAQGKEGALPSEDVDMKDIAASVMDTLSESAERHHVRMTIGVCEGDTVIRGVGRLLYEIVYNLCDNAIRYNKEGGSVRVDLKADDHTLTLSVADTGIGIPPEHRSRVFERFYRVDKSRSRESGGTGLGLSIVKHAAAYHHAQITCDSEVDVGTTITVTFPKEG